MSKTHKVSYLVYCKGYHWCHIKNTKGSINHNIITFLSTLINDLLLLQKINLIQYYWSFSTLWHILFIVIQATSIARTLQQILFIASFEISYWGSKTQKVTFPSIVLFHIISHFYIITRYFVFCCQKYTRSHFHQFYYSALSIISTSLWHFFHC